MALTITRTLQEDVTETIIIPNLIQGTSPVVNYVGVPEGYVWDDSRSGELGRFTGRLPIGASRRVGSGILVVSAINPEDSTDFDTYTVNWLVTPKNTAPTLNEGPYRQASTRHELFVGDSFSYNVISSLLATGYPNYPPGLILTSTIVESSGTTGYFGVTFDSSNGLYSGTVKGDGTSAEQDIDFATTFANGTLPNVSQSYYVKVKYRDPVFAFDELPPLNVNTNQYFQFVHPELDIGAEDARYSAADIPAGVTYTPNSRNTFGSIGTVGTYTVTYTGTNPAGNDTFTRQIIVTDPPARPTGRFSLDADENVSRQDIWKSATDMYISDDVASDIKVYNLVSRNRDLNKENFNLTDSILLAPRGITGSPTLNRFYVADALAKIIAVFELTTGRRLESEDIPLIDYQGNTINPGAIAFDEPQNTLYVAYSDSNIIGAYDRLTRRRDPDNDLTSATLPSGVHRFFGLWVDNGNIWIGDQTSGNIYVLRIRDHMLLHTIPSLGSTLSPRINPDFSIPSTEIAKAFSTGNPHAMAYDSTNNHLYIANGTTLYRFEPRTTGGKDFYRKDATGDIDASTIGVTTIGSAAFDGTGILMITNLGIKGINLDGTTYTTRDIPRATLDTLAGTGARNYNIAFQGQNTYFIVGRSNGPTDTKAVYVFRGTTRRAVDDIPGSEIKKAFDDQLSGVTGYDYTEVRIQGATTDSKSLFLYDRLYRTAPAFNLATKKYEPNKSFSRFIITNDGGQNLQGWSFVYNGVGFVLAGNTAPNIKVFGYGFSVTPPVEALQPKGIGGDTSTFWYMQNNGAITPTVKPTIAP